MIYNKPNRTDKQAASGLSYFFKGTVPGGKKSSPSGSANLFDAATKYYSAMPGSFYSNPMELKNCFALTLAYAVIDRAGSGKYRSCENSMFSDDFYSTCAGEVVRDGSPVEDRELVVIYLKQSVHMLEKCGILFRDNDSFIHVKEGPGRERVYRKMLNSFWNMVDWKEIFPSSTEAADSLYRNRVLFTDLLCEYYGSVNIEELCNDFFDLTGICGRNDSFMISFVDFYLLSWLFNFGIIEYSNNSADENIYVSLTESGRSLLKTL